MSDLLTAKLSRVREKHTLVAVFTGAAMAVGFFLVWTTLAMWLDWHVANGLPRWGRGLILCLEGIALAAIIVGRILRPMMRAPDDEEVALMIERQWPDFKTRLIASIQLSEPEALAGLIGSKVLVSAMVRQTEALAEETPVTEVVATKTLNRSLSAAAVICCLAIFLFLWTQPASSVLLGRAFLSESALPTKTHIESVSGDLHVALGDALKISATVSGYKPAAGSIDINYASRRYQELPLDKDPNTQGTYTVTLDAIQESFTYSVHIYDGHSETFSVKALERPAVASIEFLQVYPAYTGLGTVQRQPGDLTLLAGSRLKLKVTSTKPLRIAALGPGQSNYVQRFIDEKMGHSDMVALLRSRQNVNEADAQPAEGFELPPGLSALSIHLIDTDDLESKDTAVYPVEIIPDRPPTVRLTAPERKEELVTAQAQHEIGFLAEDDILLGKLTLLYKVDEGSVESIPLPLPRGLKSHKSTYLWDISKIAVPAGKPTLEGSVVEYWLEVADTNNLSGPGKGVTEHYAARVVTRAEKQAEMMARSGETITGIKAASEDQDTLADKVGKKVNQQPGGKPPAWAPAKP